MVRYYSQLGVLFSSRSTLKILIGTVFHHHPEAARRITHELVDSVADKNTVIYAHNFMSPSVTTLQTDGKGDAKFVAAKYGEGLEVQIGECMVWVGVVWCGWCRCGCGEGGCELCGGCACCVAVVWLLCDCCVAVVWVLCGCCVTVVWLLCGCCVAVVWLLWGCCDVC